jgi:hypothetical protein
MQLQKAKVLAQLRKSARLKDEALKEGLAVLLLAVVARIRRRMMALS